MRRMYFGVLRFNNGSWIHQQIVESDWPPPDTLHVELNSDLETFAAFSVANGNSARVFTVYIPEHGPRPKSFEDIDHLILNPETGRGYE